MVYNVPGGTVNKISVDILFAEHSLIAGTTGAGKSVLLNTVLTDLHRVKSPLTAATLYIDFKRVELKNWSRVPHCVDYCINAAETRRAVEKISDLMFSRYDRMTAAGIKSSSDTALYIVIDELAFLLQDDPTIIPALAQLLRLGRAANIHLIAATQSPNRKSLPADLAQNFTCAVALRCRSAIESRQIIGIAGAEKLPVYGSGIQWDKYGYHNVTIPMTPESEQQAIIDYWNSPLSASVR